MIFFCGVVTLLSSDVLSSQFLFAPMTIPVRLETSEWEEPGEELSGSDQM